MASIEEQLKNARTMEDIVNLLSILFTNLNNQNEQYFDMFLNPVPMDLDLERYNEKGELEVVVHPNVAKMRISAYSGDGNPNGVQEASVGALYIDTSSYDLYYKAYGDSKSGWMLVWSASNLQEGTDYLSPTGDGSQVQNLNANNITSGILSVVNGGTGTSAINGLVKGNGTSAFTAAVADDDYLVPSSFVGLVMYSPVEAIPDGWLICNGEIYTVATRPELARLCNKLGSKYGGDGINTFGVPNLIDRYIKGGLPVNVGKYEEGDVKAHSHTLSGKTGDSGSHKHNKGNMRITGYICANERIYKNDKSPVSNYGVFKDWKANVVSGYSDNKTFDNNVWQFDTNLDGGKWWTGETGASGVHSHSFVDASGKASATISTTGGGTNEVNHLVMVPIIKY